MAYERGTLGQLLFFIRTYCPSWISDHVMFDMDGKINYHRELFATYEWDKDKMPVFTFVGQYDVYNTVQQHRREQTIKDFLL